MFQKLLKVCSYTLMLAFLNTYASELNLVKAHIQVNEDNKVFFGSYPQLSKSPTPIEWRILKKEGKKILVISEYCIEAEPYNIEPQDVMWQTSTVRTWLNRVLINKLFTKDEQQNIIESEVVNEDNPEYGTVAGDNTKDKIFLLDIKEALTYFKDNESRMCKNTKFIKTSKDYIYDRRGYGYWWLRSPGDGPDNAAFVDEDGEIWTDGENSYYTNGVIRPALWLAIE